MFQVGVDIVELHRIERSVQRHGTRFLQRVYTESELAYCRGDVAHDDRSVWIYVRRSNGRIFFRAADNQTYRTRRSDALSWDADRWYRVRVVLDNTAKTISFWRAYKRTADEVGVGEALEVDEEVGTGSFGRTLLDVDATEPVYVGRAMSGGQLLASTAVNGDIDEVLISTY